MRYKFLGGSAKICFFLYAKYYKIHVVRMTSALRRKLMKNLNIVPAFCHLPLTGGSNFTQQFMLESYYPRDTHHMMTVGVLKDDQYYQKVD